MDISKSSNSHDRDSAVLTAAAPCVRNLERGRVTEKERWALSSKETVLAPMANSVTRSMKASSSPRRRTPALFPPANPPPELIPLPERRPSFPHCPHDPTDPKASQSGRHGDNANLMNLRPPDYPINPTHPPQGSCVNDAVFSFTSRDDVVSNDGIAFNQGVVDNSKLAAGGVDNPNQGVPVFKSVNMFKADPRVGNGDEKEANEVSDWLLTLGIRGQV
jgi:hypothetical protein